MLHKPLAVAALLAASCGSQAASDADLAAIRSQIDEMKKSYEQRIAALEQRLAQLRFQGLDLAGRQCTQILFFDCSHLGCRQCRDSRRRERLDLRRGQ